MKQVWKYEFTITDAVQLQMPIGAKILSVQLQGDLPCLWALVDPSEPTKKRYFRIFGTGHNIDLDDSHYIGTFMTDVGALVWHMFEVPAGVV